MAIHKNISGRGLHQPGQYQVINETLVTIPKGKVVQIVGLNNFLSVEPVDNPTTNNILGVAADDIQPGEQGYVARMGLFGQFDTTAFPLNAVLYSDGSGDLSTSPLGPQIGRVMSVDAADGNLQLEVFAATASGGSDSYNTVLTTLTQTDIDNGFINLPATPSLPTGTIVALEGAPSQTYGSDFTVLGNQLNFANVDDGDLGNILTAGDILTIMYK